jgi:hypothetical protein
MQDILTAADLLRRLVVRPLNVHYIQSMLSATLRVAVIHSVPKALQDAAKIFLDTPMAASTLTFFTLTHDFASTYTYTFTFTFAVTFTFMLALTCMNTYMLALTFAVTFTLMIVIVTFMHTLTFISICMLALTFTLHMWDLSSLVNVSTTITDQQSM